MSISVVNYSSNIDHLTESSSNGDLLNTLSCRCGIGRVVTSVKIKRIFGPPAIRPGFPKV